MRWIVLAMFACAPLACISGEGPSRGSDDEATSGPTCEDNPSLCETALCDPLAQDCPDGTACYPTGSGFDCFEPTGSLQVGDRCGFVAECSQGLFCVPGLSVPDCDDQGCCTEFCDLDDPSSGCTLGSKGASCLPFFSEGPIPPGLESLGACLVHP